jgi:hypothetical protein
MWPKKYPWNLLPRSGPRPYKPPERQDWLTNPPSGPQNGYLDGDGNEWVPHPSQTILMTFIGTWNIPMVFTRMFHPIWRPQNVR